VNVQALEDYMTCPSAGFAQGDHECKYWYKGVWVTKKSGEQNPFIDMCETWQTCSTEAGAVEVSLWSNGNRYWLACQECNPGHGATAKATVNKGTCVGTLAFDDNCFKQDMPTDFKTCPNENSEYRITECSYLDNNGWSAAAAGAASPFGATCQDYTLCSSTLPKLAIGASTMPTNKYFIACNACGSNYWAEKTNNSPTGNCAINSKPVMCSSGAAPTPAVPTPTPPAPTPVPNPTPAPVEKEVSFLEKHMIELMGLLAMLAFFVLIVYIFMAKKKRQKKKIARLKKEMKSKRNEEGDKEKMLEMGKMLQSQQSALSSRGSSVGSGKGLSEAEKDARKAKKKAEKARIRAALDDGLPEGWRSFTDKGTGGVYYCHMETGETTWTRPVKETVVEREVPMTGNPMRSDAEEQNALLKEQMKKLVENNRNLKKDAAKSAATNNVTLNKIDSAKRKKAIGTFKKAVAGVTLARDGSSTADKIKAMIAAAKAEKEVDSAQAQFPPPPKTPMPAATGAPPPGPAAGASMRNIKEEEEE